MTNEPKQQPLIVWWIIWAALLSGVFVIYFVVGADAAPAKSASPDSPAWMAGFASFLISAVIRWIVLPRVQDPGAAFPLFVVGMALAESACILGIFVFPAHKLELFALGVLGIAQFVPYFASGYSVRDK